MFTLDNWSADDYDNLTEYLKSNAKEKIEKVRRKVIQNTLKPEER